MESILDNDVLTLVLHLLDDVSLGRICLVDKHFNSLCNESFWQQRTTARFAGLLSFRAVFSSWREFYSNVRDSTYAVMDVENSSLHSNIHDAYKAFLRVVDSTLSLPIERAHEIPQHINNTAEEASLYIMFPDREIKLDSEKQQVLMSLTYTLADELKFCIRDDLLGMPVLGKGTFFFHQREIELLTEFSSVTTVHYSAFIGISRLTEHAVERLRDSQGLVDNEFLMIKVDDSSVPRRFERRGETPLFGPHENPSVDYEKKLLVSHQCPPVVIDEIDGRLMTGVVPVTKLETAPARDFIYDAYTVLQEFRVKIRFRRFYSEVQWEPIGNLKDHPVVTVKGE